MTRDDLITKLDALSEGSYDYNTSAEAALEFTVAAFDHAASVLGLTGFQADYVALSVVGKINGYDGPYGIIKAEDMLYPQYSTPEDKATEFAAEWADWLRDEARKRLAEFEAEPVHASPRVVAHWRRLAEG